MTPLTLREISATIIDATPDMMDALLRDLDWMAKAGCEVRSPSGPPQTDRNRLMELLHGLERCCATGDDQAADFIYHSGDAQALIDAGVGFPQAAAYGGTPVTDDRAELEAAYLRGYDVGFQIADDRAKNAAPVTDDRLRAALAKWGEHQHEWAPFPMRVIEGGAWRDAVEPEEGWDRTAVRRFCPDEDTGDCWCGLRAALADAPAASPGDAT